MVYKQHLRMQVILYLYILIFVTHAEDNAEKVREKFLRWTSQLSDDINKTFTDSVGLEKLQHFFALATYKSGELCEKELLENISFAIDRKLQKVLLILVKNKELIESLYPLINHTSMNRNCCDSRYETNYNARFKGSMSKNITCTILSSTKDNSYVAPVLKEVYKSNLVKSRTLTWQYFGSSTGSYHQYPGNNKLCCSSKKFDPRLSSWYAGAAMPTRKNVIIIIDNSGSMSQEERMSLARAAALTVLETLNGDDYVTSIAFSGNVEKPPGCFGYTLAKATDLNLNALKKWITELQPQRRGGTIYSYAFREAFKMLENFGPVELNGKSIILFLTDGEPTDQAETKIYPSIKTGQKNMNNSVTILTYGLGTGIQEKAKRILRIISSDNGGEFSHIEDHDYEKLKSSLGSYYKYFITAGNIAFDKAAVQSTLNTAGYAVDGNMNGSCSQTEYENNPWWRVDLNADTKIMAVTVLNCCRDRMEKLEIRVTNDKTGHVYQTCGVIVDIANKQSTTVLCPSDVSGRYVYILRTGKNKHLSLCEVKVYKPLALSTTLSLPCTAPNGTMFGVAAIDISLNELFSELILFPYGQYSYGIVIDMEGRVWFHPRSPRPDSVFGLSLLPLRLYESWANEEIMKQILATSQGHVPLRKILLQIPRGYSGTDGTKTLFGNGTLFWKKIKNMFIVMVFIVENDKLMFSENLTLASQIIKSSFGTEVNKEFLSGFYSGIEADLKTIAYLKKYWADNQKDNNSFVMSRYIATQSGVYLRSPGVTMVTSVDHKDNAWFRRAKLNPEQFALSYSIDDYCSYGKVISISSAINKNIQNTKYSNGSYPNLLVAGIDMTLISFKRMALNAMPGCLDEYDCFLMDQSGYLFLSLNKEDAVIHVTKKFTWLGKEFVELLKILKPNWCNNFQGFKVHFSYEIVLSKGIASNSTNICHQYLLLPLQGVSSLILAVPSRKYNYACQDQLPSNNITGCYCSEICHSCSSDIFTQCQCPCICPMSFDRCTNSIISTASIATCPVLHVNTSLLNDDGFSVNMNASKVNMNAKVSVRCENICNKALTKEKCNEMEHCNWCETSIIESCETICPFSYSRQVQLKFSIKLNLLNSDLKNATKKSLQENIYNTLGDKLENNIQNITFKKNAIILEIRGTFASDIYKKFEDIKLAIKKRKFYLSFYNNTKEEKIYPEEIVILGTNACTEKLDSCDENAYCNDTDGYYNCSCKDGFYGDGRICEDIDECDKFPCYSNATCINLLGSFQCSCIKGFTGNGYYCSDINECLSSPCHSNTTCTNSVGSFHCECLYQGFVGNGTHCLDIDECEYEPCPSKATCINIPGSYKCPCKPGFYYNGTSCHDINECLSSPCHSNTTCTNSVGSFHCECLYQGFVGNGTHCLDVNECDNDPCHSNATCTNNAGSFKCSCKQGYAGNGLSCSDIDECEYEPCPSKATCINIPGSYKCPCKPGFYYNGTSCHDSSSVTTEKAEILSTDEPNKKKSVDKSNVVVISVIAAFILATACLFCTIFGVFKRNRQKNHILPKENQEAINGDGSQYTTRKERYENRSSPTQHFQMGTCVDVYCNVEI